MSYDKELTGRVRRQIAGREGLSERKMFGGLAFMLNGNMFCRVVKDDLMLRVGPEQCKEALAQPHVRPMDFTGRPMKGMVYLGHGGYRTEAALKSWEEKALKFALSLPAKRSLVLDCRNPHHFGTPGGGYVSSTVAAGFMPAHGPESTSEESRSVRPSTQLGASLLAARPKASQATVFAQTAR